MIRSMYSGISGMKAFQEALGVTSNNIANAQTTGFKGNKAVFEDLFYQTSPARRGSEDFAGTNPQSMGSGVKISSIRTDTNQGALNRTGGKTDVGIEGEGYFVLGNSEGNENVYTRKGTFQLSEDSRLVNDSGQFVLGWNVNQETGEINTFGKPVPIYIELDAAVQGEATSAASLTGNLNNEMKVGDSTRLQFPSYDVAGNRTNIEVEFIKTGPNAFKYAAIPNESFVASESVKSVFIDTANVVTSPDFEKGQYIIETISPAVPGGQATINVYKPSDTLRSSPVITQNVDNIEQSVTLKDALGNSWMTIDYQGMTGAGPDEASFSVGDLGDVTFGVNGRIESIVPTTVGQTTPEIGFVSAETGQTNTFGLNMNALTSFNTDTAVAVSDVDGNAAASVRDYSVSDDGVILAQYSDGSLREIGKMAMANFANPQGLEKIGSSNLAVSATSGLPTISASGEAGMGRIRAQALENSNVDLSSEFVDLMMFQKAFQANTKIIQVSDEVVSGVINLIR